MHDLGTIKALNHKQGYDQHDPETCSVCLTANGVSLTPKGVPHKAALDCKSEEQLRFMRTGKWPKKGRSERELNRSLKHLKLAAFHSAGSWLQDALVGFVRRLSLFIAAVKRAQRK